MRVLYADSSESAEKLPMRNNKTGEKKMNNKRIYLPAIASLFILSIVMTSLVPVAAQVMPVARALPTLEVTTIPEDDQVRNTGVMILGLQPNLATWPSDKPVDVNCINSYPGTCLKLESQYKFMVTLNGQPLGLTSNQMGAPSSNFGYFCQFVKKEKLHPLQHPQWPQEVVVTTLTDESAHFVCKLRQDPAGLAGVGVLDVYYTGTLEPQFIADYVMLLTVWYTLGRTTIWGSDIQDLCLLGWANSDNTMYITKPDGTYAFSWPDPLGPWVSCEEAAILQRQNLGLTPLYT
jgi:hypothetical protein